MWIDQRDNLVKICQFFSWHSFNKKLAVYSDNGDSLYVLDQIKDEYSNDDVWSDNIAINTAIENLGEREKNILLMRFYRGKTQTEVSEEIGISQAQVSRLEKCALEHIRKQL